MPIRVIIPTPLRSLAGNNAEVQVEGDTVRTLIVNLTGQFPSLKHSIMAEDGSFRKFVNIYVNTEDVRYLEGSATRLSDKDVVRIVPSIAGG